MDINTALGMSKITETRPNTKIDTRRKQSLPFCRITPFFFNTASQRALND